MTPRLVLALGLLASCTAGGVEPPPIPAPVEDAPEAEPPPAEPSLEESDFEPTFGPRVEREAIYAVSPHMGGKRLQAGELVLPDGERWICSYRPEPEYYEFQDKRVVATGRTYTNSPYVQSVGGTHFEIESLRLADGETPYDPVPTTLLAPPRVDAVGELRSRAQRWAHVVGQVRMLPGDDMWREGKLQLGKREVALFGHEDQLSAVDGQMATLLVFVKVEGTKLELGVLDACLGVVDECGVHRPEDRERDRK